MTFDVDMLEIPVSDMNRAVRFFRSFLECNLKVQERENGEVRATCASDHGVLWSLVQRDQFLPSRDGLMATLKFDRSREATVQAVEGAGGCILTFDRSAPDEVIVQDSEGNRFRVIAAQGI